MWFIQLQLQLQQKTKQFHKFNIRARNFCVPYFMVISFYILLFANILILLMDTFFNSIVSDYELLISTVLILSIGIPHGAIDHILFLNKTDKNKYFFYGFYLFLIALYILVWIIFPLISLSFFLILSAYHFGQSQFHKKNELTVSQKKIISFFWGTAVISFFVIVNIEEIKSILLSYSDFAIFLDLFNLPFFWVIFTFSFLFLGLFGFFNKEKFQYKNEIIYLALIFATFSLQSIYIGFSLFFVFNHSLEVLRSEYVFLDRINRNFNVLQFMVKLLPFTGLSVFGVLFFYYLSTIQFLELSLPLLLLISISSLTLPHSIVMELFYRKKQ